MERTYRNQTPTMSQIQMLATMRITTPSEAVAFLRAVQPLYTQIAYVLQRSGLRAQHELNREMTPQATVEAPAPAPVPEPEKKFEPEEMNTEEGFSEEEIEEKVAKLKSARKIKEDK